MKKIALFLGEVILLLVFVGVGGCSQSQLQPQVKSKGASTALSQAQPPAVKKGEEAHRVAKPEAKGLKLAKVTKEKTSKAEEAQGAELYVPEVKPMKPAECGRCHTSVYKTLLNEGGKHKFDCTNCHQVFHVFRAAEIWDQIVPKCVRCHGYYHGEKAPILKDCQKCHVEGHAPKRIPPGDILDLNCDKCHPKILAEMKQFPSKHSEQKCSLCHHTKHGYIPSCMECHEPHVASLTTNQQCLECHPVHSPTRPMVFKADTSNEICSACHSDEVDKLAANKSKHHNVACVECHTKHGYIPKCQECHEQPHSEALLKKFPNCLDCHIDPHNLPTKGTVTNVSTSGKK